MDFQSLTRKELQTLCKKNKIPANVTNVAMADALEALQIVQGIEEFLNPLESVTALSSIESPDKSEVTTPCALPTGGRTTRRKTVKNDVENSQTSTRARRSTRKLVVGEVDEKPPSRMVETPAATNSKRAPVASVRRKMDTQLKEVEEDHKIGNKDTSETPAVWPGSRRRGLMGENTVRQTYGTRRSARLAEKNVRSTSLKENGKLETVKSELFSEESGENLEILEMNGKEMSDDQGEIIQTPDIDLKEELEEGLARNNDKEVNSGKKSDHLGENQIQFDSKCDKESTESFVVVVRSETKIEDDGVEGDGYNVEYKAADDLKTEVLSEICEETDPSANTFDKPLEMDDGVQEKSGGGDLYLNKAEDALENGDILDADEVMVSENVATETIEKEVIAQNDAFTNDHKTLKMSEEILDLIEDEDSVSSDNLSGIDGVLEDAKKENDMEFQDGSADDLEANKYSEDLVAFDINDGALTKEDGFYPSLAEESVVILPKADDRGMDLVSALDSMTLDNSHSLEEEYVDNNLIEETTAPALNASADVLSKFQPEENAKSCDVVDSEKSPTKQLWILDASDGPVSYNALRVATADDIGKVRVFDFTAEPSKILSSSAGSELNHIVLPTCLTPSKKSASKTPMKTSASKKTPTITERLSNVFDDKENIDNSGTKLILTREKKKNKDCGQPQYIDASLRKLKKELKEKLEISKSLKKDEQMMISRPALQAVSENILAE